jgi:hypothetical protein
MTAHRAVSVVKPHVVARILTRRRVIAANVAVVLLTVAIFSLPAYQAELVSVPLIAPTPVCFLTSTPLTQALYKVCHFL